MQYYLHYYVLGPLRPAETHHYQRLHYQADSHIYDATKKIKWGITQMIRWMF